MKYILVIIAVQLSLLLGLLLFATWWTALIFVGALFAFAMYASRYYDEHHRANKFYGGIDNETQTRAMESYILERKNLEMLRAERSLQLSRSDSGAIGHLECLGCGRMVGRLFPITTEDIQRENIEHGIRICAYCLEQVRSMARLESSYTLATALRDAVLTVPVVSAALVFLSLGLSSSRLLASQGFIGTTWFLGVATVFTGLWVIWDRLKARYGFNHSLRWSVKSRRAMLGFSLMAGGTLVATLSTIV